MQADGLVRIKPFGIEITEKGHPFIRNAAMAFDVRACGVKSLRHSYLARRFKKSRFFVDPYGSANV
ncbi:MAG: hypothetical protein R3B47_15095 [Bacteroidia bacterium]